MIIRTITVFDDITVNNYKEKLKRASIFIQNKAEFLKSQKHELQTTRVSTSLFDSIVHDLNPNEYAPFFNSLSKEAGDLKIDFISLGCLEFNSHTHALVKQLPDLIKGKENLFFTLKLFDKAEEVSYAKTFKAAEFFKRMVEVDYQTTFRYSVQFNCAELIPFYPASYYTGKDPKYGIGIQLATEVNKLIDDKKGFDEVFSALALKLNEQLKAFEESIYFANDPYEYAGIDTSLAPMIEPEHSIGQSFETLMKDKFGTEGSLSVAGKLTQIAQNIDVKKTGFCGLMLPPLEDSIIGKRFSEGTVDIQKMLFYCSVCATGLDTVPISSEVTTDKIAKIYLDTATLSFKWNKPLSVRLMSISNSKPGDMTTFESPYICNTRLSI